MDFQQIAVIVLMALDLGVALALHGKPKTGNHSAWTEVLTTFNFAMLLYWAGFWKGL